MRRQNRLLRRSSAALLLLGVLSPFALFPGQHPSASAGGVTGGADAHPEWKYSKVIVLPGQTPYAELYLDPEVYAGAADDLRDLRIVDNTGTFIPFYKESSEEFTEEQVTTYTSTLVHSAKKGANTLFDYKITPLAENVDILGNRLEFGLPAVNFLLHTQLLGSYDGVAWETVADGDLYNVNGRVQSSIELGASYKYGYYRLIAENNAENLHFPTLTLLRSTRVAHTDHFKQQQDAVYDIQQKDRQTEMTIRNPGRLNISGLQLEVGGSGSFTRRFELYDGEGRLLAATGGGELYRLDFKDTEIASTTIIPANASSAPQLRIVIYNQDDAPLPVEGLKLEYLLDRLVFAAEGDQPLRLLYGNAEAAAPQYDIVNFKDYIAGEGKMLAGLGAAELRQAPAADTPQTSWFQGRTGFNIVIIAVSLLLIIFLARKLGRK
ncbi:MULTISPECIES: DUF3999 family protein [unclassified Paenibacillus]|uniref:DUF3999 family protein n=1 Tax=unclassified Paenibacillus TaxID=185978 RepID=UPI00240596A0|nr:MULTISPECIES: DUF3999 family protein [unclassified Paenibacillus]MDF9843471.1 hypothetical protein [Paenibacillus sp. PastF-2]MDF9850059.1 hypothetical protein [Paenibacillus sp. PastM-2]MDF9857737.1 hypothetical protein [Paenibacillus sp. PastF-1]MDH6483004.1 hypothetical protein [Paenibacillus sp. PastH-2]MDH6509193.1 hypothetical protein [Paenibacillus sp. PastM-3]